MSLLLYAFVCAQPLQRFNTFSYNVNDGLLQSTIIDIAFDGNNFCWISFPNGVQKFDGNKFYTIPIQQHLPDDKQVIFHTCSNGDVLVSHAQGVSRYLLQSDRFITVFKSLAHNKIPPRFMGETNNIMYIYTEDAEIAEIDLTSNKIIDQYPSDLPTYNPGSGDWIANINKHIINNKMVLAIKEKIYLYDVKLRNAKVKSFKKDVASLSLQMMNANEVMFKMHHDNGRFQFYNFETDVIRQVPVTIAYSALSPDNMLHKVNQNKYLLTFGNRIFQVNEALSKAEKEWVDFQNQSIGGKGAIRLCKADNFGNIILATMKDGIRKIMTNNYPIKYYGVSSNEGNHIISVLPDKKRNRILTGTSGNGILIFDTLQQLIKHIDRLPGRTDKFSVNAIVRISHSGDYLLYLAGDSVVAWLSGDLSNIRLHQIESDKMLRYPGTGYFGNVLFQNDKTVITQSQGNVYKTNLSKFNISEHYVTNFYTMSGICIRNQFIYHAYDSLFFVDTATFKVNSRVSFPNTGYVRCYVYDQQQHIYVGSNKGIFKTDTTGKIIWHLDKNSGLPDECIYAMLIDKKGNVWCSSNKGVFRINGDKSVLQLRKEDGLQENEFNTNVAAIADDGELYFGGVNGVSSFYPDQIRGLKETLQLMITGIRVNNENIYKDTAVWNISSMHLGYEQNAVSFDFVAMASNNPDQYIYQYKMIGIDNQWIQNDGIQTIRYFLPPGTYTLQLYASRYFNKDAVALKEIVIVIHPPFWKTWWFIISLSSLFMGVLIFSINRYNRRKYQGKLQQLENEHKIQIERERISRDLHDNIGAFANAVLHKTETLAKNQTDPERNTLMEDIRMASRDIIVSLRETIWSFKQDVYTNEACMFRIRNFVQTMIRYYPEIQFKIEDESAIIHTIPYHRALNVVRMVQEGVTNAIKHAKPTHITIKSVSEEKLWLILIVDDGKGFNKAITPEGNGLENLRQRAAQSGFTCIVESVEGIGTTVSIHIPMA